MTIEQGSRTGQTVKSFWVGRDRPRVLKVPKGRKLAAVSAELSEAEADLQAGRILLRRIRGVINRYRYPLTRLSGH